MFKKKFWKRSISILLASAVALSGSGFNIQLGNVTLSAGEVLAEETEISVMDEGNTDGSVSENEAESIQQVQDEFPEEQKDFQEGDALESVQPKEADIVSGNVIEVKSGSAASTVISDTALLKGLAFCILGDEDAYSSLTTDDLINFTGAIDFTEYEKAADIVSLKGIGTVKNATAFQLEKCQKVQDIMAYEFRGCSMQSITLPDSIRSIGDQAFFDCKNLEKITSGTVEDALPPQLLVVGSNVFDKCVKLTNIIIPDTVEENAIQHATSLFANCSGLQNVTIGSGITNIPVSAFSNAGAAEGMQVTVHGLNARLEKVGDKAFYGANIQTLDLSNCTGLGTFGATVFADSKLQKIILPDSISNSEDNKLLFSEGAFSGAPIQTMGKKNGIEEGKVCIPEYVSVTEEKSKGIFSKCIDMTCVEIPASWTIIPNSAFKDCSGLVETGIGNGTQLVSIGEEAFYGTGLKNTDFLNGCTLLNTIGKSAFEQCITLETVVLPVSVITVGERAFYTEQDLKKIAQSLDNIKDSALTSFQWNSSPGAAKSGNKRILGNKALEGNASLQKVVLPDYSAAGESFEIGSEAFAICINLQEIGEGQDNVLPASVSAIGDNAFKMCLKLPKIKIQSNSNGLTLGSSIFEDCLALTEAELPANITSIPVRTFCNAGVTSLTMGSTPNKITSSTLKTIGARSFFGCQIENLDLSGCSALEEIGGWAFAQTDTEKGVPDDKKVKTNNVVKLKSVILPEKLPGLFINSGVFCLDMNFTTLATTNHNTPGTAYIPDYVEANQDGVGIGEGVFSGTAIERAVIPSGWTGVLPKGTFELCLNMTSLDFLVNTNLSGLGEACFSGCFGLKDIHLAGNRTIKNIGKECFELCIGIESTKANPMTLPASLETIENRAFFQAEFDYLNLSASSQLKTIKDSAFEEASFQEMDLSGNGQLQTVGRNAFKKNKTLTAVKLSPAMSTVADSSFEEDSALATVDFQSVKEIKPNAFKNCSALNLSGTNLDSVEKIGDGAFQNCKSLKNVKFGPKLISIGGNAFNGCSEILDSNGKKTMSDSVKVSFDFSNATSLATIGREAFGKSAVTEFDISKTAVSIIENNLCKSCELLEDVTFGTSVKYINADALAGCPKLGKVSLYSATVIDPKAFNALSDVSRNTTNKNLSITVEPVKEAIKVGINETMDFPYYVHMVNTDTKAPQLKAFRHIVAGDGQNPVPEGDREHIYMAVSGDVDGYFINKYSDNTTLVSGKYANSEGGMSDNFQQMSHTKEDAETNRKKVDVFRVTGVKEGSYPVYVCCQVQFPLNNSYEIGSCIKTDFTTKYKVEVIKAWYKADLYQKYDNRTGLSNKLQPNSVTKFQADSRNEKPKLYYDLRYTDEEMESSNIKDWNVTVVSDNPAVMYPGKNPNDGTAKMGGATPGMITTTVGENNKNNQSQKFFHLIPAGMGTAHITVYPASHPAGSANAEKYAQTYTYVVGADLKSIQLQVPNEKRTLNPGQTVQVETKITNCLNQTATITSAAEAAKYTNNKLVYETNTPALLTTTQNGLVKAVTAEMNQKSVDVSVTATKSDGKTISAKTNINVRWPEIKENQSYKDTVTGAVVTVTKKGNKDGEVTYKKAGSTTAATIKIPSTVTISGVKYKVTKIAPSAFKNNKKLKTVTIPSSVTEIGSKAFYGCTALKKITLGSNVKIIGSSAFYNCKALTSVTIGKKVTSIGSKAFYNCKKLKKITIKSTVLSKVGSKAFKNIYKKATIKVPRKKLADYKKLLKGKGQSKTVKIKK